MYDDKKTMRMDTQPTPPAGYNQTSGSTTPMPVQDPNGSKHPNKGGKAGLGIVIAILILIILVMLVAFGPQMCSSDKEAAQPQKTTQQEESSSATENAKEDDEELAYETNKDVKIDDLVNQNWANAQKILKSRNADLSDPLILTDDGKEPLVPSNWTVESIELGEDGQFTINLIHSEDLGEQAAGAASDAAAKAKGALDDLKEEAGQ